MKVRITKCSDDYWYDDSIGQTFEVYAKPYEELQGLIYKTTDRGSGILVDDCEIIEEPKEIPIKPFHNVQNPNRPNISQEVINGFAAIVDAQDGKGLEKYGRSIDDANDVDYDWKLMALEECADHAKYLVREIKRLEAENQRYKALVEKVIQATNELEEAE